MNHDVPPNLGLSEPIRIVYVGPGLAGKRTSLAKVLGLRARESRPPQPEDRAATVELAGLRLRVTVETTTSLSKFTSYDPLSSADDPFIRAELDSIRRAHAFIFVVDPRRIRAEASQLAFARLARDLAAFGRVLDEQPLVFQVNVPPPPQELLEWDPAGGFSVAPSEELSTMPMQWVREHFRTRRCVYVESRAHEGIGTDRAVVDLVRLLIGASDSEPGRVLRE